MNADERADVAQQFGVALDQVERDHLVSHLLRKPPALAGGKRICRYLKLVHRLARHPHLPGDLRNRPSIADHRQHGLIPLLDHAQLPHLGSVKDQPKQLSSISRNTVRHTRNRNVKHQPR
jgi:hypothetical protein